MGVFSWIVLIANVLYWVFLDVYFAVRLLGHFDNTRYLADCQRADGGRLRVIVEEDGEKAPAEEQGSEETDEIGDVEYRETPWFPFLMALIALFLLLVLCLSWEAWSARESLSALLRI